MKLVMAACWVTEPEDQDDAVDVVAAALREAGAIKGAGEVVTFTSSVASRADFRRDLRAFDLTAAASFEARA